ncbi:MAG: ribonuclease P protein component [Alphaproteobacteria bacterium]
MPPRLQRLKNRSDFQRVARARHRAVRDGLILQAAPAPPGLPPGTTRIGFTASRRVGNAVTRNRARRRLKAVVDSVLRPHGAPGHDYVLIARRDTPARPFGALEKDLAQALRRLKLYVDADADIGDAAPVTRSHP